MEELEPVSTDAAGEDVTEPIEITKEKLLLGEGRDEKVFFEAFLRHLGISNVQVIEYDGKSNLDEKLRTLSKAPNFRNVVSLGVTRDADYPKKPTPKPEAFVDSVFQGIRSALLRADIPAPKSLKTIIAGTPNVGVFILPDCRNNGMLENLCLESVRDDERLECITDFVACVEKRMKQQIPRNRLGKSQVRAWLSIQAWLAVQKEPDLDLGISAMKKYWNFDHPAFDELKKFVVDL